MIPIEFSAEKMRNGINVNTGVSVGIAVILIIGIVGVKDAISNVDTSLKESLGKLDMRVQMLELKTAKSAPEETWNESDMYKWAVHLQQANKDIKGFRVPEPKHGEGSKETQ